MRLPRKKLEAAARAALAADGFVYEGESILACAESKDPNVYNPRAAKAVENARNIIKAFAAA